MTASTAHLILDPKPDHIALFASLEGLLAGVIVHDALVIQTDNPKIARLVADLLGPGSYTPPAGVLVHYHTGADPIQDLDQPTLINRHPTAIVDPLVTP